jgi:hypothetical protein
VPQVFSPVHSMNWICATSTGMSQTHSAILLQFFDPKAANPAASVSF